MATIRERALDALLTALRVSGADVSRGSEMPTRIPAAGMVILRDGDPGEAEVTLSPPVYHYAHRAEVEVYVQPDGDVPDALDALLAAIGAALAADPTLGGACQWCEPQAPRTDDLALEGMSGIGAAIVPVILYYQTTGPLA